MKSEKDFEKWIHLLKNGSIFSLNNDEAFIHEILTKFPPIYVEKGTLLAQEGKKPTAHVIPLNFDVLLSNKSKGDRILIGKIIPGRSLGLYSVITEQNFNYDGEAESDGFCLMIPIKDFQNYLSKNLLLKEHLLKMSHVPQARDLSNLIKLAKCSNQFRYHLIGAAEIQTRLSQSWLVKQNEIGSSVFYQFEGSIEKFPNRLLASHGKWLNLRCTWEGVKSEEGYRTVSSVKVFVLTLEKLKELNEKFPTDFKKWYAFNVEQGDSQEISAVMLEDSSADEESDEEVEDIHSLFVKQKKHKRKWYKESYPWVQQGNQMDCGPSCLSMISRYYDKEITLQYWRSLMSTDRQGTSLYDMAQAAERMGFIAHCLQLDSLLEFPKDLLPIICLREYHFVVVYKIDRRYVTVGDPARGIIRMSHGEFMQGFEQAALVLKPTEKFFEREIKQDSYSHYFSFVRGLEKEIFLALGCSFLLIGVSLIPPIVSQFFIDHVLSRKDMKLLWIALAGGIAVGFVQLILTWIKSYYLAFVSTKFDFKVHAVFLQKVLSLPYHFFSTRHVGDITHRLTEMESLKSFLIGKFSTIAISLANLVVYLIVLTVYSPLIAGLVVALAIPFLLLSHLSSKKLSQLSTEIFQLQAEQTSQITDLVRGLPTIKTLSAELAARLRYEEQLVKFLKTSRRFSMTHLNMDTLANSYGQIVNYILMGASAYLCIIGNFSMGQVMAVTMIAGQVISPLVQLVHEWADIQNVKTVMNRLNDVLLSPSEKIVERGKIQCSQLKGTIEFRDVWFRYGGESSEWILKGVSFKIDAGQNVALVGPSGSGKSTIAHLITRLYEPTKGQIFIDGRDYREYDVKSLRAQCGFLHQDPCLFKGSIAENISYATPELDEVLLTESSKRSASEEFILKKPGQFEFQIPHGGLGLSGGEKQRIALARTLYSQPSLMILDEATASLDGIAEAELLKQFKANYHQKTILNIAHRLSTVRFSDKVVVLRDGQVVGFGSHLELLKSNKTYLGLFGDQMNVRTAA